MRENMDPLDCQNLLGFLNQKNVYKSLNITKWMKLEKLDFESVYSTIDQDLSITRRSILHKMILIVTSYFCVGTEIRFLKQLKEPGFEKTNEDMLWHG